MQKHLISYDLCNPGRNYDDLIDAIKSYPAWAHISGSCWAVQTAQSDKQICDNLLKHIDANDKLFVCAFSGCAWYKLPESVSNWLKS